MKQTVLFLLILLAWSRAQGQALDSAKLAPFDKIIISPNVNLILKSGDSESIDIDAGDIPVSKVNVKVKRGTLHIYLDHARITEKKVRVDNIGNTGKKGIYGGRSITVFVTYRKIKSLEMRGEGELRCESTLRADKFKIKAYGETHITLASLEVTKFKASLYGENKLTVLHGSATNQVYRLFGENRIETGGLQSETTSARLYGEGRIHVNASDEVTINAFGEPVILVDGTSLINKGIILGHADIRVTR